jgi:maltose alpha-D-glucosyltransferase/alpha-amylase
VLEQAAQFWYRNVSAAFLRSFLDASMDSPHVPETIHEIQILLNAHLIEKALYEVAYELNNRPDWVRIPLRGLVELVS